jgi:hypothetical protein
MYANLAAMAAVAWTPDLRDYARWEYGTEDAALWLAASARKGRHARRRSGGLRAWLRSLRILPATSTVARLENRQR